MFQKNTLRPKFDPMPIWDVCRTIGHLGEILRRIAQIVCGYRSIIAELAVNLKMHIFFVKLSGQVLFGKDSWNLKNFLPYSEELNPYGRIFPLS